jgi:GNAT superfamily N-acetyltransferase
MVTVEPLGPDDVGPLRDVRLRSLADAPGAFTSTYEREAAFDDATWRDRLVTCRWFVARSGSGGEAGTGPDGGTIGVVGGLTGWSDDPRSRQLVAMWVDPSHRRHGVARALLAAVAGWAADDGASRLELEVVVGNRAARTCYLGAGFRPAGTGHHALAGGGSAHVEILELDL